jgi:hypothetical protein
MKKQNKDVDSPIGGISPATQEELDLIEEEESIGMFDHLLDLIEEEESIRMFDHLLDESGDLDDF